MAKNIFIALLTLFAVQARASFQGMECMIPFITPFCIVKHFMNQHREEERRETYRKCVEHFATLSAPATASHACYIQNSDIQRAQSTIETLTCKHLSSYFSYNSSLNGQGTREVMDRLFLVSPSVIKNNCVDNSALKTEQYLRFASEQYEAQISSCLETQSPRACVQHIGIHPFVNKNDYMNYLCSAKKSEIAAQYASDREECKKGPYDQYERCLQKVVNKCITQNSSAFRVFSLP